MPLTSRAIDTSLALRIRNVTTYVWTVAEIALGPNARLDENTPWLLRRDSDQTVVPLQRGARLSAGVWGLEMRGMIVPVNPSERCTVQVTLRTGSRRPDEVVLVGCIEVFDAVRLPMLGARVASPRVDVDIESSVTSGGQHVLTAFIVHDTQPGFEEPTVLERILDFICGA